MKFLGTLMGLICRSLPRLRSATKMAMICSGVCFLLATSKMLSYQVYSDSHWYTICRSTLASGPDFYVSPAGNDSNHGSYKSPWRTIQRAASSVTISGATVHVAPGTYEEGITSKHSGTATEPIRFISDVKWGAKIISAGKYATWHNYGSYVHIIGFDISRGNNIGIWNDGLIGTKILSNYVHDVVVTNIGCTNGAAGIDNSNYDGNGNDVIGNVVLHIGNPISDCAHGIYQANYGGHIQNNVVANCGGWGLHLWHAATHVVVSNNLVWGCGVGANGGGIVVGAGDSGEPHEGNDYTVVTNNIVIYNVRGIWEVGHTGRHNKYAYNLLWNNSLTGWRLLSGNTHTNDITSDPLFVNFRADGTGNYRLTAGSPAIHAGTKLGAPRMDIDSGERSSATAVDIGAYENGDATLTKSPTPLEHCNE